MPENFSFEHYGKLILFRLEQANNQLDSLAAEVRDIARDQAVMKTKVAMFGAGTGLVAGGAISFLVALIK